MTKRTHDFDLGEHVTIVAGRYEGKFAIVDEFVGASSLWVFIMLNEDDGVYATVRATSVA